MKIRAVSLVTVHNPENGSVLIVPFQVLTMEELQSLAITWGIDNLECRLIMGETMNDLARVYASVIEDFDCSTSTY